MAIQRIKEYQSVNDSERTKKALPSMSQKDFIENQKVLGVQIQLLNKIMIFLKNNYYEKSHYISRF